MLVFDVTEVAQTLVIADYLARKLGHYPEDDRARLVQQMATSAAFSDLIEPYAHLFWLYPEKPRELERRISQHAHRTRECIERLEELLPITGPYFEGANLRSRTFSCSMPCALGSRYLVAMNTDC